MSKSLASRDRRAITRIESLIVFAIIVILIGLLLPCIAKVREASARASGLCNLKQIALAANMFNNDNSCIPTNGTGVGSAEIKNSGSWGYQILPYIEQNNAHAKGGSALDATIKTFVSKERGRSAPGMAFTDYAWNCYLMFATEPDKPTAGDVPNAPRNTTWNPDGTPPTVKIKIDEIPDGSSNTILAGHKWMQIPYAMGTNEIGYGGQEATGRGNTAYQRDSTNAETPGSLGWGGPFSWGGLFALADGSARSISYAKGAPDGGAPNKNSNIFGYALLPSDGCRISLE